MPETNNKKSSKNIMGAGIAIGIGTAIGVATDNMSIWITIWVAICVAIGAALTQSQKTKIAKTSNSHA